MRSLLRVKRSADCDVDRVRDGGRAIAVGEGVSAYVFSAARAHSCFRGSTVIPAKIIKSCRAMTAHLEVSRRSAQDWEYAILAGYRVFRDLVDNHGGTVRVDLRARGVSYRGAGVVDGACGL